MARSNSDWWQHTATAFGAVLVTVAIGWFTGASEFISAEEARQIAAETSPYLQDRRAIHDRLDRQDRDIATVVAKVDRLVETMAELTVQLRTLAETIRQSHQK